MYNNIETLIKHQGWARGSKINYLIQKNMIEGKSKEEERNKITTTSIIRITES